MASSQHPYHANLIHIFRYIESMTKSDAGRNLQAVWRKTMTAVLQEAIEALVVRKEKLAEKRQEGTLF